MSQICETCLLEHEADDCPRCAARRARLAKVEPMVADEPVVLAAEAPDADALNLEQGKLKAAQALEDEPDKGQDPVEPEADAHAFEAEATGEESAESRTTGPDISIEERTTNWSGHLPSERLREFKDQGVFVVALLGFPTAGKTWFLNRLKKFCVEATYTVMPPPPLTKARVPGTDFVEAHHFVNPEGSRFVVIDIPGERFQLGMQKGFAGESLLLDVMRACRALIVVLPADEVLFADRAALAVGGATPEDLVEQRAQSGKTLAAAERSLKRAQAALDAAEAAHEANRSDAVAKRRKVQALKKVEELQAALEAERTQRGLLDLAEVSGYLRSFLEGIGRLAGIASMLDHNIDPSEVVAGNYDKLAEHIDSAEFRQWRKTKPVFAALTKADLLLADKASRSLLKPGEEALLDEFDLDPLATVRHFRPELVTQFRAWFGWSKFDFVTAFGGHDRSLNIDYRRDHYGVWPVIDWIWWAFDVGHWKKSQWASVRMAQWLRARRDGPQARARSNLAAVGARRNG